MPDLPIVSLPVVLVVEDHPIVRFNAVSLVNQAGYEAVGAIHADDAIRILEERTDIKVVFTDIEMPGTMDGMKLAHYVRERWPPIHLLIASGRMTPNECLLPANTRFFSKPYDDTTIVAELKRLLTKPADNLPEIITLTT